MYATDKELVLNPRSTWQTTDKISPSAHTHTSVHPLYILSSFSLSQSVLWLRVSSEKALLPIYLPPTLTHNQTHTHTHMRRTCASTSPLVIILRVPLIGSHIELTVVHGFLLPYTLHSAYTKRCVPAHVSFVSMLQYVCMKMFVNIC